MGDKTTIEWTDATWNPVRGCTKVSDGCRNCYAMGVAARFSGPGLPYEGLATRTSAGPQWTNNIMLVEDALSLPLHWTKPRRIFVNSMSDLFHKDVPFEYIDRVFAVMALCPQQHTFQILTKRPERMREYLTAFGNTGYIPREIGDRWDAARKPLYDDANRRGDYRRAEHIGIYGACLRWPLPNVWLGTSCENQETADERIPELLRCPAAVRFVSAEPLLGPIDLMRHLREVPWQEAGGPQECRHGYAKGIPCRMCGDGIHWLIAGGESGPHARPMHPHWVRSLRDQCVNAHVPFLFKQWGAWSAEEIQGACAELADLSPNQCVMVGCAAGTHTRLTMVGKKAAGRELDGREWNEFPGTEGQAR